MDRSQELRFRRVYDAELPYVLRTLRRLGVRAADVEDVAHEVFLVVYRKLDEYDASRPIRSWLFGIAYRATAHHFERAHQRREVAASIPERADEAPSAEQQLEDAEARAAVIDALAALGLDQRAVCILHDLDGVPVAEIADIVDAPVNTVYSRLRLGRQQWIRTLRRNRLLRGEP